MCVPFLPEVYILLKRHHFSIKQKKQECPLKHISIIEVTTTIKACMGSNQNIGQFV